MRFEHPHVVVASMAIGLTACGASDKTLQEDAAANVEPMDAAAHVDGHVPTPDAAGVTDAGESTAGDGATSQDAQVTTAQAVCGTAAEGQSVTLTCPSGSIVGQVTFASYGDPTGECQDLVKGLCNATSSTSAVEDLCLGQTTCNVPASNSVFADPCSGTVKRLGIKAACIAGTPVAPSRPFKGVANSPCDARKALGVSWYYNWGTTESEPCADPSAGGKFVPMIWGSQASGDISQAISGFVQKGYTHVLGFNEPDHTDQAHMTVADAIALWPAFDNPGLQLVSPAAASDGQGWAKDFMSQVQMDQLRVDVFAIHWYGWNAGSCDARAAGLESYIQWAEGVAGARPIWITEWGCLNQSAPDEGTVVSFYNAALEVFARHPRVQRYAWYPWSTNCGLVNGDGTLTALGQAYAAAPAYR